MIDCRIMVICCISNPSRCVSANIAKLCNFINYLRKCNEFVHTYSDFNLPDSQKCLTVHRSFPAEIIPIEDKLRRNFQSHSLALHPKVVTIWILYIL